MIKITYHSILSQRLIASSKMWYPICCWFIVSIVQYLSKRMEVVKIGWNTLQKLLIQQVVAAAKAWSFPYTTHGVLTSQWNGAPPKTTFFGTSFTRSKRHLGALNMLKGQWYKHSHNNTWYKVYFFPFAKKKIREGGGVGGIK